MIKQLLLATVVVISGCKTTHEAPQPPSTTVEYDIQVLLTPYQISPPVSNSPATGKFSLDLETYQYVIRIHGFDFDKKTAAPTPLAAHLHCAKATANGPAVYKLSNGWKPSTYDTFTATGMLVNEGVVDSNSNSACSFEVKTLADIQEALDAGEIYVNVQSIENPFGEIRGQIYDNSK